MVGGNGFLDHRTLAVTGLHRFELLLEARNNAVGELAGAPQIAAPLRPLELGAALIQFLLDLLRFAELLFLVLPAPRQRPAFLFLFGNGLVEARQPLLGGDIALLTQ